MLRLTLGAAIVALSACATATSPIAFSDDPARLRTASEQTLSKFLNDHPEALDISNEAEAVMVFPSITKGGFIYSGHYGRGTLFEDGEDPKYVSSAAASYGFQAGGQRFSYVMFFMTPEAIDYMKSSRGFELGYGPSLTVLDKSFARNLSTSSLRSDIYVSIFDGQGLMAGGGIQGTKITLLEINETNGKLEDSAD